MKNALVAILTTSLFTYASTRLIPGYWVPDAIADDAPAAPFQTIYVLGPGQQLPPSWIEKVTRERAARENAPPQARSQGDAMYMDMVKGYFTGPDPVKACNQEIRKMLTQYPIDKKAHGDKLKRQEKLFSTQDLSQQLTSLRQARTGANQGEIAEKIAQYNEFVRTLQPIDFMDNFGGARVVKDGKSSRQICGEKNAEIQALLSNLAPLRTDETLTPSENETTHLLDSLVICTERQSIKMCSSSNLSSGNETGTTIADAVNAGRDLSSAYFPSPDDYMSGSKMQACLSLDVVKGSHAAPQHAEWTGATKPNSPAEDTSMGSSEAKQAKLSGDAKEP